MLSAVATMAFSLERGAPSPAGAWPLRWWLVAFFSLPSSGKTERSHSAFLRLGEAVHPHEITRNGEEAFYLGSRIGHGANVQVGNVAHIDDAEVDPRATRNFAIHQALHD